MSEPRRVYLDHHATTPCDPRVVEAMAPMWTEVFGNPSSVKHAWGRAALERVEQARREVAALIGASPKEIVFTSGATEAINLALQGLWAKRGERDHVVTMPSEHKAVLDTVRELERRGARVTMVPPEPDGRVDVDRLAEAVGAKTLVVAIMAANNEIGTLQPIAEIGALCKERGAFFLTDATQAAGRVPLDVRAIGADLLAMSAHKLYGPKGVGALWVRRRDPRVRLAPLLHGGGHERGMRSGTLNAPGIVGFGRACAIAAEELQAEADRTSALRDRLWAGLTAGLTDLHPHGTFVHRLPNNLMVSFAGCEGDALMVALHDVAVSSASACSSQTLEPSHVLRAIGVSDALAYNALRFGVGRFTTEADIDFAVRRVCEEVARLRALR